VTTVSKALALLDLFTRNRPEIGLSDAARLSGLNKATCHRLLSDLAEHGLVEQTGPAREYRLGPAILHLAALREAAVPMREAAQPVLRDLARTLQETVHLSVLAGERLQMLAFAYSTAHAMTVRMEDADTLPFHATSSGLAVLAHGPRGLRDRVLAAPLPRLTGATVTDPARLAGLIDAAAAQGFATITGSFEAEVASLAVPVFGPEGCVGALAVAAPSHRLSPELAAAIRQHITEAAGRISTLWGGSVPPAIQLLWQAMRQPQNERA
jgi:DNA-binding IclR family transcriptional regulator